MVVRSERATTPNRQPYSLPAAADVGPAHAGKIMIALMATLVAGLAIFWSMTQARAGGTVDEQMACTPDVFRLCSSERYPMFCGRAVARFSTNTGTIGPGNFLHDLPSRKNL